MCVDPQYLMRVKNSEVQVTFFDFFFLMFLTSDKSHNSHNKTCIKLLFTKVVALSLSELIWWRTTKQYIVHQLLHIIWWPLTFIFFKSTWLGVTQKECLRKMTFSDSFPLMPQYVIFSPAPFHPPLFTKMWKTMPWNGRKLFLYIWLLKRVKLSQKK